MIENDIRILLDAPRVGEDAPSLGHLEEALTAGYARAMALEAEQARLQRRIAESAAKLVNHDSELTTAELKRLAQRLQSVDVDVAQLRGLLGSLRARASDARAAAA